MEQFKAVVTLPVRRTGFVSQVMLAIRL